MSELGNAYLNIVPTMRNGATSLRSELTGAVSGASGDSGKRFAAGFGKSALKAMGAIGLGVSVGEVFSKGWKRMTAIDEAKAKLKALGHSVEEVQAISENANAAVKGTAYGMDQAMTAAAAATAAGIAPGKELTRYLSLMGDAAAVAGVDINEMGSIFNKVAANGKVTTEEMNQLADRGIPIWQLLAKETGKSIEELRKDITAGKVDINDFQNAIEAGMGGAAKTIGSTTLKGAISNIGASLSRIGANFLGSADDANSFAGKLLPLFNKLMGFMSKVEGGASTLGHVFGSVMGPIMDGLGKVFTLLGNNTGKLTPIKDILMNIGSILGSVISAAMPIVITNIRTAFKVLGPVLSLLGKVVGILTPIIKVALKVATTVAQVASKIISRVASVVATVTNKVSSVLSKIKSVVNKIKGFFPLKIGKIFSSLKVPKINISGGKAPFGIGGLGRAPKISVSWHAKAMENPYLFSNATLFGAGETGDEILYGRQRLLEDIAHASGNIDYNLLGSAVANAITNAGLETIVQLDGRTIARGIAKPVQNELNKLQSRDGRKLGYV